MKHVFFIFASAWLVLSGLAAIPSTVQVSAPVAPSATNSPYGAQVPRYGYGGFLTGASSLAQLQDTNWFPIARRTGHVGMMGVVTNTGAQYILGDDLVSWYNTGSVSNMAQLRLIEPGADGSVVNVNGYYSPGEGGNAYTLVSSTSGTNTLGGKILALGGSKSWVCFPFDPINVKSFGAIGNGVADDTASFYEALAFQTNNNITVNLFAPAGDYRINGSLNLNKRTSFYGSGQAATGQTNTTIITFTHDNAPGFSLNTDNTVLQDMTIRFLNYQTNQTSSAPIVLHSGSYLCKVIRCRLYGGYDGIRTAGTSFQNRFQDVWITGWAHSAFYGLAASSGDVFDNVYCQNTLGPSDNTATVVSASRAGATITVTLDSIPPLLTTNRLCSFSGMSPAAYNTSVFVKTVSGNTITFDLTSDPGADPSVLGTLTFLPQACNGPPFYLQGEFWAHNLNVEYCVFTNSFGLGFASQNGRIGTLHIENLYPETDGATFFFPFGPYSFGNIIMANCGVLPGKSAKFIRVGTTNKIEIANFVTRDVATTGSTYVWATTDSASYPEVLLIGRSIQPSARANADATPSKWGWATAPLSWSLDNLDISSGNKASTYFAPLFNATGSGRNAGIWLNPTVTATSSAVPYLAWFQNTSTNVYFLQTDGREILSPVLGGSSGSEYGSQVQMTINQSGTAQYAGHRVTSVENTLGGTGHRFYQGTLNGTNTYYEYTTGAFQRITAGSAVTSSWIGSPATSSGFFWTYGDPSIDRAWNASPNSVQVTTRGGTPSTFAVQPTGAYLQVGSGVTGTGLKVSSSGSGIAILKHGTATLVGGTVTVSDASVTAGTLVYPTVRTIGGTPGTLFTTLSAGVSFTINSSSGTDTSVVTYLVIVP